VATPTDAKARAAATYNAASDHYDDPANAYWDRYGRRTVDRLVLRPGMRVLDVCCGSGASGLPAAEAVAPDGQVLGVDLAEKLLALARAKAQQRGLTNIEFRTGDMLDLGLPEAGFDAVVCVFGIFFVPDIPAAVRELWRFVAPGGALAITTWGPRFVEPMGTAFWNAVRDEQPDLYRGFNPWDRITEPQALSALFADAGLACPQRDPGVRLPAPPLAGGLVDNRARHGFSRHGGCPRPGGSPTRPPGQPRLHPRRECPGSRNQRDLRHPHQGPLTVSR